MPQYKVTRKNSQKAPSRKGLLGGASRKQADVFSPKTGSYIKQPEYRLVRTFSGSPAAGTTTTLYTCPAGRKAKLMYYFFQLFNNSSGGIGVGTVGLISATVVANDVITNTNFFGYETGINISSGETVTVSLSVGSAGNVYASVVICEEEASDAYLEE